MLGQIGFRQLALLLVLVGGCGAQEGAGDGQSGTLARVTKVTDGDTLWLSDIGKVRLIGVDTPEVNGREECFGREARGFAQRTLPLDTSVHYRLGAEARDRYGRGLVYVYLDDGRLFNELLAARGYAVPLTVPPNDELAPRFVAAARRARQAKLGLWQACQG